MPGKENPKLPNYQKYQRTRPKSEKEKRIVERVDSVEKSLVLDGYIAMHQSSIDSLLLFHLLFPDRSAVFFCLHEKCNHDAYH